MAPKPINTSQLSIGDRIVGTANTQLQFTFETFNIAKLSILFQSVGGNFQYQGATIEVSADNTNWVTIQQSSLGDGNLKKWRYTSSGGTQENDSNLVDFPYVRITVPALGSGISCTVTYGGKP